MKKVLITGVSGGLGACLATEYLKMDYQVYGYDINDNDKVKALKDMYQEKFEFILMDTSSDESVLRAGTIIKQRTDSLDILINAAAILSLNSAKVLEEFDITQSLELFDVNTLGPLRVVKDLLSLIKKGEEKLIVNISSEAGSMTTHCDYITRYDYCMSKAALNMQSIILQRYLKKDGIKVLLVHPGWIKTDMGGQEAPLLPSESAKGIVRLTETYKDSVDMGMFFDYDGSTRAW
ncbi:MAG TPA: SDR family NAD(P)-dependent oxidoreductase [Ruminiclostridium sp.]